MIVLSCKITIYEFSYSFNSRKSRPGGRGSHPEVVPENRPDPFRLFETQEPIVDENASEPASEGPVDQRCRHGGIDAARKPQYHFFATHLFPDFLDGLFDEGTGRPVGL